MVQMMSLKKWMTPSSYGSQGNNGVDDGVDDHHGYKKD